MLAQLRNTVSTPMLVQVPEAIIAPVRDHMNRLEQLVAFADQVSNGQVTEWDDARFATCKLDLQNARRADKALLVTLNALSGLQRRHGV